MSEIKYRLAVDPSGLQAQLGSTERLFGAHAASVAAELDVMRQASVRFGNAHVGEAARAIEATDRLASAVGRIGSATGAILGGLGVGQVTRAMAGMADEVASMEGRLKLATGSAREYAQAQADIAGIAERQRAGLVEVGTLYTKTASVAADLGASQADVAKFTEATAAALALNGTSAAASAGALLQLGQAIGGANLQAEEFNSILDGARPLLAAAAKHIDGTGGSLSKLKELVTEGKVSSKDFFAAVVMASEELKNSTAQLPVTIGQATTLMRNDALKLVGDFDKVTGASQQVAGAIRAIGSHLDVVAVAGAGLAGVMGGRLLQSMIGMVDAHIVGNAKMVQQLRTTVLLTEANMAQAASQVAAAQAMNLGVGSATALAGAEARLLQAQTARAAAQSALTAATGAGGVAAGLASGAMGLLGGPLGVALTLLSAGAAAWALWKDKATDASAAVADSVMGRGADIVAQLDKEILLLEQRTELLAKGVPRNRQGDDAQLNQLRAYSEEIGRLGSEIVELRKRGADVFFKERDLQAASAGYAALVEKIQRVSALRDGLAQGEQGDKAAKWLAQMGDKAVQLQQELKKAKADFGGVIPAEVERAIRKKFAEPVKDAAAEMVKAGAKLYGDLTAQGGGLAGDFAEKWDSLSAAYRAKKISIDKLTEAQALLLAQQPAIKAAADAEARALQDAQEAHEKRYAALIKDAEQSAAQAMAKVLAMQQEEAALELVAAGTMTLAEAMERVQIERLKDAAWAAAGSGQTERLAAINAEIAAREKLAGLVRRKDDRDSAKDLVKELEGSLGKDIGANLAAGFDKASQSLGAFVAGFRDLALAQEASAKDHAKLADLKEKDLKEYSRLAAQLADRDAAKQINAYGNIAGAAKGFFKEGSRGYQALEKAEKVYRAFELAMSVRAIAQRLMEVSTVTGAKVAGDQLAAQSGVAAAATESAASLVKGQAAAVAGVANQSGGDPYTAFPRMAAMAAIMAGLGFIVGGISGGGSAPDPGNTGTGTVLGDNSAKSESLNRAMDHLAKNSDISLRYSQGMLSALNTIAGGISGLSGLIVRDQNLTTGDNFGVQTGTKLPGLISFASKIPVVGKVASALFGTKTSINGTGLYMGDQTLGSIVNGGANLQSYVDVTKKKKFFGVTYSNKSSTQYQGADPELSQQFRRMFEQFAKGVEMAAGPLDRSLEDVRRRLSTFVVSIGKINLEGLNGAQIQERLTAVFGAAADRIASTALPGLQDFQKVGEGYFETVVRVASGVEGARAVLEKLGVSAMAYGDIVNKQGDVGSELIRGSLLAWEKANYGLTTGVAEIVQAFTGSAEELAQLWQGLSTMRDGLRAIGADVAALSVDMIRGAGGADALSEGLQAYFDSFLTEAERTAEMSRRVSAQFAAAGVAMPASAEGFKKLVRGIDTSTVAGQELFGKVISLSGSFAELQSALASAAEGADALAEQRASLEGQLLQLQGNTAELRARELAQMDASLRPLKQRIWALEDEQAAAQAAAQLASQRQSLEGQLLQLQGNTVALRAAELAKVDASLRPLQQRIWALQDEQAAAQAAAQLASQRQGLEVQLLQLQGNTVALRAIEVAKLDASLRPMQERIWALQDEQAAAQAAAQAQQQLASQRESLEGQLLRLQGNTAELRARELAQMDAGLRPMQQRIWALEDEQAAAQAAAQAQQQLAGQRESLEGQLLQLQGNTAELRARELAKLDASLRPLQERLWALEDEKTAAQAAADAAAKAADAWKGLGDGLADEIKRIKGLLTDSPELGLSSLQTQFALDTAAARAGDQEAAARLPALSNSLLTAAEASASSSVELKRLQAATMASLEGTLGQLQALAALRLPAPGVVPVGAVTGGQAGGVPPPVVPADPSASPLGELVREVRELRAEVSRLRSEQEASQFAIAAGTGRVAKVLERVSPDGDALLVRAAA